MSATYAQSALDRPVCTACREQQWRWIETRPQQIFRELGYIVQAGATYDTTPAGVRDNRHARYERWRTLVLDQIAGIADDCRHHGHEAVGALDVVDEIADQGCVT